MPRTSAAVPAAPVMVLYAYDGPLKMPYYDAGRFARKGAVRPAGTLTHGTYVVPCLIVRDGKPLTSAGGTPYVGFRVILDPKNASHESIATLEAERTRRLALEVPNHHCEPGGEHVIDARRLFAKDVVPFVEPPLATTRAPTEERTETPASAWIRRFHNSTECINRSRATINRRHHLESSWQAFIDARLAAEPEAGRAALKTKLERARGLDYVMRTAMFEGHLKRGCSSYGACERNVIALSIRNRAFERCSRLQGCRFKGDLVGVTATVSQFNIWDEWLTQISAVAACFLRDDRAGEAHLAKLRAMYAQSIGDIERIVFGDAGELRSVFAGTPLRDLRNLRHYFHPPAMGKCFPGHPRVEYISAAAATSGSNHVLIANTRVRVGAPTPAGYPFELFRFEPTAEADVIELVDSYPGFALDKRKVSLRAARGCTPFGVAAKCKFESNGRYRKLPYWYGTGVPMALTCQVQQRGVDCGEPQTLNKAVVGGRCDPEMQPMRGVP